MSFVRKVLIAVVLCCVMASLCAMEVKVIEVSGKVEVQKGDKWVAVAKGDVLPPGSVISTGFKSEVVIAFDETVIKVKALTRLTIEQLFEKNGDKASSVYLDTGSISADVKPAENKRVGFSVKTPAATASVRGTSGDVFSDGTVIGTGGKWCITPPEPRLNFVNLSQDITPVSTQESANTEEPAVTSDDAENTSSGVDVSGSDTTEPAVAETTAVEPQPVVTETPVQDANFGQMEDFDFSYPNDLGAVYVNPGESASVRGSSFVTPQDNKVQQTTGSAGMQLLSETEKVTPVAPQAFSEVGKPASESVVVPEKPKYGTVNVVVTLPSL